MALWRKDWLRNGRIALSSPAPSREPSSAPQAPGAAPPGTAVAPVPGGASLPDPTARIRQLETRVDELQRELEAVKGAQQKTSDTVECLKNTAVRPVCSQDLRFSVHPVTSTRDACDPYLCNEVEGVCRQQCSVTSHCMAQRYCDAPRCIAR